MYSRKDLLDDMKMRGANPLLEEYPISSSIFYQFLKSHSNSIIFVNCQKDVKPIDIYYWNKYHRLVKRNSGDSYYISDIDSSELDHFISVPKNLKIEHDYAPPGITVLNVINCTPEEVLSLRKSVLDMHYGAYIIYIRGEENSIVDVKKFSQMEEMML